MKCSKCSETELTLKMARNKDTNKLYNYWWCGECEIKVEPSADMFPFPRTVSDRLGIQESTDSEKKGITET